MHILVSGGAQSGKGIFAEEKAMELSHDPIYISTCEVMDEDILARLASEKTRRGKNWSDLHAPINLAGALMNSDYGQTRLVDNMTVWAANLLYHERDWRVQFNALLHALEKQKSPVIFLTEEIGMGVAPENEWLQCFREIVGVLNLELAKKANAFYFMLSGIPLQVK